MRLAAGADFAPGSIDTKRRELVLGEVEELGSLEKVVITKNAI